MPPRYGKDRKGKFVRWGNRGKKYHYSTKAGRSSALRKAKKQGAAIHASRGN